MYKDLVNRCQTSKTILVSQYGAMISNVFVRRTLMLTVFKKYLYNVQKIKKVNYCAEKTVLNLLWEKGQHCQTLTDAFPNVSCTSLICCITTCTWYTAVLGFWILVFPKATWLTLHCCYVFKPAWTTRCCNSIKRTSAVNLKANAEKKWFTFTIITFKG